MTVSRPRRTSAFVAIAVMLLIVVNIDDVELKAATNDSGVRFLPSGYDGGGKRECASELGPETSVRLAVSERIEEARCVVEAQSYVSLDVRSSNVHSTQLWPPCRSG